MALIHIGSRGVNGLPVVWLYPPAPPARTFAGLFNGELAAGSISASKLVGPLQGKPLSALIDRIMVGSLYVNIHTQSNPDGLIRGQMVPFKP
jgi:hypothetical protein